MRAGELLSSLRRLQHLSLEQCTKLADGTLQASFCCLRCPSPVAMLALIALPLLLVRMVSLSAIVWVACLVRVAVFSLIACCRVLRVEQALSAVRSLTSLDLGQLPLVSRWLTSSRTLGVPVPALA
jgi:hypothetical protein